MNTMGVKEVTVYKVEPERCVKCHYGMFIGGMWACGYCLIKNHTRTVGSDVPKGYCKDFLPRKRTINEAWINTPFR